MVKHVGPQSRDPGMILWRKGDQGRKQGNARGPESG